MKYTLKNKEIELSEEEVNEIIKQNSKPIKEKVVGIAINSRFGGIKFQSTKTTFKEAVVEGKANLYCANLRGANLNGANLRDADLSDANLRDANLSGAEMQNVKFYGRGGTKPLKRSQLPSFLSALGFIIED